MIVSEIIKTKTSEIWIDEEGILRLKVAEGSVLEEDEVIRCFDIYRGLMKDGKKFLQIIDGKATFTMTPEGRAYAAQYGKDIFTASAMISDSLAVRLLVNFFNTFHKPELPFKMFSKEEEALKWLRRFRE